MTTLTNGPWHVPSFLHLKQGCIGHLSEAQDKSLDKWIIFAYCLCLWQIVRTDPLFQFNWRILSHYSSPVQTISKNHLFVKASVNGFAQVPDYLLFEVYTSFRPIPLALVTACWGQAPWTPWYTCLILVLVHMLYPSSNTHVLSQWSKLHLSHAHFLFQSLSVDVNYCYIYMYDKFWISVRSFPENG